jgi:hypothetical protein
MLPTVTFAHALLSGSNTTLAPFDSFFKSFQEAFGINAKITANARRGCSARNDIAVQISTAA